MLVPPSLLSPSWMTSPPPAIHLRLSLDGQARSLSRIRSVIAAGGPVKVSRTALPVTGDSGYALPAGSETFKSDVWPVFGVMLCMVVAVIVLIKSYDAPSGHLPRGVLCSGRTQTRFSHAILVPITEFRHLYGSYALPSSFSVVENPSYVDNCQTVTYSCTICRTMLPSLQKQISVEVSR